jgi:hypothetical protein
MPDSEDHTREAVDTAGTEWWKTAVEEHPRSGDLHYSSRIAADLRFD